jgi:hypothetical protein
LYGCLTLANIPATPGLAKWTLNALPTIWAGTPKISENDSIYSDLTDKYQALSTPGRNPDTPSRVAGILKTPGTVGRAKNVAFTGISSMSETSLNDGKEEATVSSTQLAVSSTRVRSGLPANFPGKFPSPWTPKTGSIHNDSSAPVAQITAENTKANATGVVDENEIVDTSSPPINEILAKLSSEEPPLDVEISDKQTVDEETRRLQQNLKGATEKLVQELEQRAKSTDVDNPGKLQQRLNNAMDYARKIDNSNVEYRAKLARVLEMHTDLYKQWTDELALLRQENRQLLDQMAAIKADYRSLSEENIRLDKDKKRLTKLSNSSHSEARQNDDKDIQVVVKDLERTLEFERDEKAQIEQTLRFESKEKAQLERTLVIERKHILKTEEENSKLRRELLDYSQQVAKLEATLDTKQTGAGEMEHNLLNLKGDKDKLLREIRNLEDDKSDLQRLLNEEREGNHDRHLISKFQPDNDLKRKLDETRELEARHRETTETLRENIRTNSEQYNEQIASLERRLETTKSDLNAHVNLLVQQLARKSDSNNELQQKLDKTEKNNRGLIAQVDRLQMEIRTLAVSRDELDENRRALQVERDALVGKARRLEGAVASLAKGNTRVRELSVLPLPISTSPSVPSSAESVKKTTERLDSLISSSEKDYIADRFSRPSSVHSTSDISMKDITREVRDDITMKDASYNSSRSSTARRMDLERQLAAEKRLNERRSKIKAFNNSRTSIC